ncbi:uncharacterized protein VP01_306g1 [Puccinia sorghi]|uniref:Peptidase S53 activation domain-containing protein n=1 Tax=Puccinia sorghi TaxID=27349 RepID=A0A0L6UZU7_9BASI|nr:uncharacterized protein VP01_306g1 [Puccinia sorghi]
MCVVAIQIYIRTHIPHVGGAKVPMEDAKDATLQPSVLFEKHQAPTRLLRLGEPPGRPHHPTFRPHLNDEEFAELIQPDDESIQAVVAWLTNHGFQSHHMKWIPHKDWISLEKIPLRKVEYMLNTTYSIYQDQDGEQIVRTEEYSLPELLHPHIELIQPNRLYFPVWDFAQATITSEQDIGSLRSDQHEITGSHPRYLSRSHSYYKVQVPDRNIIATTGYLGESSNSEDAQLFLKTQRSDQVGKSFDSVLVNGGSNPKEFNQEQIDRQLGLTLPTRNIFYSVGGNPPFIADLGTPKNDNESFLEWLQYLHRQPIEKLPKVISSSCEEFFSISINETRSQKIKIKNRMEMKNSLKLKSSHRPSFGKLKNHKMRIREIDFISSLIPCAHILQCNSSCQLLSQSQMAAEGGASLPAISWTKQDLYNRTGRGYPDVSGQGSSLCTDFRIIALLNDYSISLDGPSLGYLNPWLYATGYKGLKDITLESASGCNTSGFRATEGWDPVTGLGTPDFKQLQDLIRPWSLAMEQSQKAFRSKLPTSSGSQRN